MIGWIIDAERRNIQQLLAGLKPGRVLDIGSGTGATLDLLPARDLLVAVDRSPVMLKRIPRDGSVRIAAAAAKALPFADRSFDLVTLIGVSEYLKRLNPMLREAARILHPGGHLLLTSSPPSIWTVLRLILGNRLHPRTRAEIIRHAEKKEFRLMDSAKSLMQEQFLFQYTPGER